MGEVVGPNPASAAKHQLAPLVVQATSGNYPRADAKGQDCLDPLSFWLFCPKKARSTMTCRSCRIDCRKFGKRKNRQWHALREGVHRSPRQHLIGCGKSWPRPPPDRFI